MKPSEIPYPLLRRRSHKPRIWKEDGWWVCLGHGLWGSGDSPRNAWRNWARVLELYG